MNYASNHQAAFRIPVWPWVFVLLGVATIVINAGFLAACWKMMHLFQEQQQQTAKQTHGFHVELLDNLKQIAVHAPASATEDLCQVRFRLRFPNGIDAPVTPFRVELFRRDAKDSERLTQMQLLWNTQPILNFGFLPPGEYRLSLENSLGMKCDHDFHILPGVPVDRVAYCPMHATWIPQRTPFDLKIQSVWPTEWDSQPIVAVYHLAAGAPEIHGWKWQAPKTKQFHHWLVAGNLRGPLQEKPLCDVLPDSLFENALPPELAFLPPEGIPVAYGTCELKAISFVLDKSQTQQGYVYLGTCRFAGEHDSPDPRTPKTRGAETILPESAPWWDIPSQPAEGFPLEIPSAMVRLVAERAKLKLQVDMAVQIGPSRFRTPSRALDSPDSRSVRPTSWVFASPSAAL